MRILRVWLSVTLITLSTATAAFSQSEAAGEPGIKQPAVAGLLSAVVPGTGSFYAGNGSHGGRHLAIAALSTVGVLAGSSQCQVPFGDSSGCGLAVGSAAVFVVNWVWSITVATADAHRHNYLQRFYLALEPRLVPLEVGGETTLAVELGRLGI